MTCPFLQMNWLAVVLAYVASVLLGLLWYSSLLFRISWLRVLDSRIEEISREELRRPLLLSLLIPNLFSVMALAVLLAWLKPGGLLWPLLIAGLVSIGFMVSTLLHLVYAEGRSRRLTLINAGYLFCAYTMAALILTLFA